jgi:hypothetical protein
MLLSIKAFPQIKTWLSIGFGRNAKYNSQEHTLITISQQHTRNAVKYLKTIVKDTKQN